ncbi:hypothetical protein C8Q76DRAFT_686525 [Earliella scabrosa]|nr:hypothetical protein C8Q76DRAFT_686525 [Earliella scabrosa]
MPDTVPAPTDDRLKEQIRNIRACIRHGPPYCQGTVAVPAHDLTLFYGTEGNAHRINLGNANATQLQHLAETCQPATFGVDNEDVMDETYRKAGKLDTEDFLVGFEVVRSGILDVVHSELAIDRLVKEDAIRAELYKLNVYGPGSFFKPHVDTPRSELQFGSLVIVFPTTHEGGELKIRHPNDPNDEAAEDDRAEWTFDSNALLTGCTEPSIAYVAFFSDVEHEVMPVLSGYRLTITYNLYWAEPKTPSAATSLSVPCSISTTESDLKAMMQKLLDDPTFLPDGGRLMFGLAHKYPLPPAHDFASARDAVQSVGARLKANDAVIYRVMQDLSLSASFKILYSVNEKYSTDVTYIACDRVVPLERMGEIEGGLWRELCTTWDGLLVSTPRYHDSDDDPPVYPVQWVTAAPRFAKVKTAFVAYGNQALMEFAYWRIYLLVRVGPAGDRSGAPDGPAEPEPKGNEYEEWCYNPSKQEQERASPGEGSEGGSEEGEAMETE